MPKGLFLAVLLTTLTLLFCQSSTAEPTGNTTTISHLRPYVGGNTVYVYMSDTSPCGVSLYTLDLSTPAGKAAYAQALAALVAGKQVRIEVVTPCAGIYTPIQSIYTFQ
jgi:hypothetical protein